MKPTDGDSSEGVAQKKSSERRQGVEMDGLRSVKLTI
jgi:hypothetical protein